MTTTHAKRKMRDLASLTSPEIQQCALKATRRMHDRLKRLPKVQMNHRAGYIQSCTRFLASEYLPAIQAVREATYRSDLEALGEALIERLDRGTELAANAKRDRLWIRLLLELEIVYAALADDCLAVWMDRLQRLEARHA